MKAAGNLPSFTRPLVARGAEDRMMPPATGHRPPPRATPPVLPLRGVPGRRTLVQLDDPAALVDEIRRFVKDNPLP
ncbi:hypothetical protein ABT298_09420 [Streptomyces sp. NPDC001034]|uniref:hypothetical protein n=1 Tax=Streptomyces sp. NPDC001034 TaxID=3154375 RepID=UPI0033253B5B